MKINIKNLIIARANAGLTTEEITKMAKISKKTYSQIENGHTKPNIVTIGKIAKALNISVETLFIEE